jgi:uncharacterized membrane protein
MDKKIIAIIILGMILLIPISLAYGMNNYRFFHYRMMYGFGHRMWFGPGLWMHGFGMFYVTLTLIAIILLLIYLIVNSKK